MRTAHAAFFIAAIAVALAGCQRTSFSGLRSQPTPAATPLTPSPVGQVETSELTPPAADGEFPAVPEAPASPAPVQVSEANAGEVSREQLIGRWTVTAGTSNCDVFLALTKWTGGYRAASRGCIEPASGISAWDVQGKQVLLSDSNGNQIARLFKTAPERFDGSTAGGQAISLTR